MFEDLSVGSSASPSPSPSPAVSRSPSIDDAETPEVAAITGHLEALLTRIQNVSTFEQAILVLEETNAFLQPLGKQKEKYLKTKLLHELMESVIQMRRRVCGDGKTFPEDKKKLMAEKIAELEYVHVRLCAKKRSTALSTLSELRLNLLKVEEEPFLETKDWAMYRGWYSGAPVTVKRLKMNVADPTAVAWFEKDARILRRMQFPYIKQYFGSAIGENAQPFLVTARYQISLANAIHRPGDMALRPLTIEDKFQIAQQIAAAISWLHGYEGYGYLHRNIKPSCVMLNHEYTAFLGDFGFSVRGDTKLEEVRGSLRYMDPRMFVKDAVPDKSGDIYSYVMLLYELFTGQVPLSVFDDATDRQQFVHAMRRHKQELITDMLNRMTIPGLDNVRDAQVISMLKIIIARGCALSGMEPLNSEQLPGVISDCAFKHFSLPPHLLARYKKITGNIFLSRISLRDFLHETDIELGVPESKAGKSEYAQCLTSTLFCHRGRDISISDVQNLARWLPHDDDLLLITGKKWFFGDCEDGLAREILEDQHMHGYRAFAAIVEQDPKVPEPFLLTFVLPTKAAKSEFPLSDELLASCSHVGNVATVHIADITALTSNARLLESKGYTAPVMIE